MNIPISRTLIENLILPLIAIVCVGIFDLYSSGQKRFEQNVALIVLFGLPTMLGAWLLLDKRFKFKEIQKVRQTDRLFQLPFSSHSTLFIFLFSPLFLVTGIALIISDKQFAVGFSMFLIGLVLIILTAIAVDHPKIWFSDTINVIDLINKVVAAPLENDPAYQDGVFSFADEFFTFKDGDKIKTFNWSEITLIQAYKVDQITTDCIIIEILADVQAVRISDQTAGFMKFMDVAAGKLRNFRKDWFQTVAFPAFETNATIIYEIVNEDR